METKPRYDGMPDSTPVATPGRVVEIEFCLRDPTYPHRRFGRGGLPRRPHEATPPDDRYAEYFTVSDGAGDQIEAAVARRETVSATRLQTNDGHCLYEFLVSGDCPAVYLAKRGALPRQVIGDEG